MRAGQQPDRRWWPAFFLSCAIFGFLWAITLLSYLLPPREIWGNLVGGTLTPNQARFIVIGSVVFTLEFMFARHLFCRFGCAVGLFQSLAWMANPKGPGGGLRPRARARLSQLQHRQVAAGLGLRHRLPDAPEPAQHQAHDVLLRAVRPVPHRVRELARRAGRSPNLEWKVGLDAVRETLRQRRHDKAEPWKSGSANAGTAGSRARPIAAFPRRP